MKHGDEPEERPEKPQRDPAQRGPTFAECFRFLLASPGARRDLLVGGTLLFTLLIGWIFNLGHRLDVIYRLSHDEPPYFRGFAPWGATFRRGLQAAGAIALYLAPSIALGALAVAWRSGVLGALSAALFILAVFVLPGGMTYNAACRDMSYLYRPDRALRRAVGGGRAYLRAWLIGLSAIGLSFLGVLAAGVGFFYTSVWAWSVVGYAFSRALLPLTPPPAPRRCPPA